MAAVLQGYLAHNKTPRPENLKQDDAYGPMVVPGEGGVRGTAQVRSPKAGL